MSYEDHYLGAQRVKVVQDAGETRTGVPLKKITFEDGSSAIYSERMLEAEGVITPTASDATAHRAARIFPVTKRVLELMLDYNLQVGEVAYLGQMISASVNKNLDDAETHQWGVEYLDHRTMDQVDKALMARGERKTLKDVLDQPNG